MCAIPLPATMLLPGTGSDEVFVRAAFGGALRHVGVDPLTPSPPPGAALADGYLALMSAFADDAGAPVVVGGVSFGAHLAAEWALANRERCAGLLLALPAWHGAPGEAPGAVAARLSADLVDREGVREALAAATAGVAPWLARELRRAWQRHGRHLPAALRVAAERSAPTLRALAELDVPVGIAACHDDPVHPAEVAHAWANALPCASVHEISLAELGADRESLGRAAVLACLRAAAGRREARAVS
jgi:pimeloyl-ACP methyl ester carboxylesterase